MSEFAMPIMERDDGRNRVKPAPVFRWPPSDDHRKQALRNHSQTLERLRERGGVCWEELRWILTGRRWREDSVPEQKAKAECLALFPQPGAST